ncbi:MULTISPECIES: flagellar hook-length control protein FliK [unclassified Halomonas]|uniref:flagellar hook-length control protein FliK n=1 Tax=unclassified Halomonas TaxID=2609666 RepID=UPI000698645B|nr:MULTISPECIES: flagellar hook-length control protein FliK [unclassified Halomonas]MCO7214737.1 flagellar hook-length control protein FliK [Halomonas sp. OfavH-34-E]
MDLTLLGLAGPVSSQASGSKGAAAPIGGDFAQRLAALGGQAAPLDNTGRPANGQASDTALSDQDHSEPQDWTLALLAVASSAPGPHGQPAADAGQLASSGLGAPGLNGAPRDATGAALAGQLPGGAHALLTQGGAASQQALPLDVAAQATPALATSPPSGPSAQAQLSPQAQVQVQVQVQVQNQAPALQSAALDATAATENAPAQSRLAQDALPALHRLPRAEHPVDRAPSAAQQAAMAAGSNAQGNLQGNLQGQAPAAPAGLAPGALAPDTAGWMAQGTGSGAAELRPGEILAGAARGEADASLDAVLSPTASQARGASPFGSSLAAAMPPGTNASLSFNQAAWPQQLGQTLARLSSQGGAGEQQVELRLHPAELGSLGVTLKLGEHGAQAQFFSAHSQVRQALEQAIPQLREALAEQGIQLGDASVSDQGAQFGGQQPSDSRGQPSLAASGQGKGESMEPATTASSAPDQRHESDDGRVDIYA